VTPRILLVVLVALVPLALILAVQAPAPSATTDEIPADSATFTDQFLERLGTVQEATDALVDLGDRRERNLLVVSQRQAAMNAALDATDTWLGQQPAHQSDPAVAAYRAGAAGIRQAMADAQSAFLRFDWDGIAAANTTLRQGKADVTMAEDMLQSADGP
jgi:hypothetical protein